MTDPGAIWAGPRGAEWAERNRATVEEMDDAYLDQYRMTRTFLADWTLRDVPRNASFLDVGTATGAQLDVLASIGFRGAFRGCDLNADAVASSRWPSDVADVRALPYADGAFDVVLSSGTLMHVPFEDKPTALREMARVSRRYVWGFEWETRPGHRSTIRFEDDYLPPAYLVPLLVLWTATVIGAVPIRVETWRAPPRNRVVGYLIDLRADELPELETKNESDGIET